MKYIHEKEITSKIRHTACVKYHSDYQAKNRNNFRWNISKNSTATPCVLALLYK